MCVFSLIHVKDNVRPNVTTNERETDIPAIEKDRTLNLRKILTIGLLVFFLGLPAAGEGSDINVLLITVDTLRYDRISFLDDTHVATPKMDALAARSAVFHRAFAHNPVTLPSHVNILTGTTPLFHGISDNPGFKLEDSAVTLAEHLKDAGYSTAAFVAAFPLDSRFGLSQGFDLYDDNYGIQRAYSLYFAERSASEMIIPTMGWISKQTGKWFAWMHLFDPHEPYDPPAPYDQKFADDLYSGEAAFVDSQLGVLFDFLKNLGFMKNTMIILTADHGEGLGDHGEISHSYYAYNSSIHIPLIIYLPEGKPVAVEENVSHVDIFPTVCDMLGLKPPKEVQGESLLPLIKGKSRKNNTIYFESLTPYLTAGWAPLRGFIRGDLKYIDLPIPEVYDLKRDLAEENNLAAKADLSQLSKDLKKVQKKLQGKGAEQKLDVVEQDMINKMRSLGYISAGSSSKQKKYTAKDDLKSLLPLQMKMIRATKGFRKGDVERSIRDLEDIIASRPDYVPAYSHLSNLHYSLGDKPLAVETLRKGLSANKKSLYLMSRLGLMLVEVQKYDEAIGLLEQCIAKEKTNPDYFLYLGVAHQKGGRFETAMENYKKALELDKSNSTVYSNIGSVHLMYFLRTRDLNQHRLAVANFNNALAFNPFNQAAKNGIEAANKFKNQLEKLIQDSSDEGIRRLP